MSGSWKRRFIWFWRAWGRPLLLALIIVTSFRSAIADWNDVPTGSMKPTILEGDRIFVNKLAYGLRVPFTRWRLASWNQPRRGDLVVFFSPADEVRLVKRVVGVPGDELAMRGNRLLINGSPLEYEPPVEALEDEGPQNQPGYIVLNEILGECAHQVMIDPLRPSQSTFGPVIVPPDTYFMMGDNRDNSRDSRFFGFVSRERIVGQATAVVFSVRRNQHFLPRWDRFFVDLS